MKCMLGTILATACLFFATSNAGSSSDELMPISNAEQVVAVTTNDWGRASDGKPKLVVAVWPDGTIVWSKNWIAGGTPYLKGKIEPTSCSTLLKRLDHDGYFANESLSNAHFGPDSQFTSILIKNESKKLEMQSWHELFELSGKIVCTSGGSTGLKGNRLESLANDTKEYVHYRLAWAELRLMINQLIPTTGQTTNGDIHMDRGIMSWKPNSK